MKKAEMIALVVVVLALLTGQQVSNLFIRNLGHRQLLHKDIGGFSSLVAKQKGSTDPVMRSRFRASVLNKAFEHADTLAEQMKPGIDSQLAFWLLDRTAVLIDANDVPGALATLDLLRSHGAVGSEFWYRLGSLYRELAATELALEAYRIGAEADPDGVAAAGWPHMGITLYSLEEWERVVDLLDPIWAEAPDPALNRSGWRTAAIYLAASLRRLDRSADAEEVTRRLAGLDPDARDWQMNQAQVTLGDSSLSRGDLVAAIDHYSLAYNIALEVPAHARVDYERKAWGRLESLAEAMVEDSQAEAMLRHLSRKTATAPANPGLAILLGLVSEKGCDLAAARAAYTGVDLMVGDAGFIRNRLPSLSVSSCPGALP